MLRRVVHYCLLRKCLVPVLVSLVVLAGCGSEPDGEIAEDRQFANDPVPTAEDTVEPTPEPTVPLSDTVREPRQATPETLLRTRGAPSTLYTVRDGDLMTISLSDRRVDENPIGLPAGTVILGFDASPTGDRVGVLSLPAGTDVPVVEFYAPNGERIDGPYGIGETAAAPATPGATPVVTPGATPVSSPDAATAIATPVNTRDAATPIASSIATPVADVGEVPSDDVVTWIPQGRGVLVVWNGEVFTVEIDSGAQLLRTDGVEGTILSGSVSPKGSDILLHAISDEGRHSAYLLSLTTDDVHELRALRAKPGNAIGELTWLPTGNGVVFVRGPLVGDLLMQGQLFWYEIGQEVPSLIATSGQGGPSATITTITISPDGHSVAYDVSIRDRDAWFTHSLWVKSLRDEMSGIQVPVDNRDPVTGLAWTREGLVWMQTPDGGIASMNVMAPSGDVFPMAAQATPGASPVASPVAATPVTVGP